MNFCTMSVNPLLILDIGLYYLADISFPSDIKYKSAQTYPLTFCFYLFYLLFTSTYKET